MNLSISGFRSAAAWVAMGVGLLAGPAQAEMPAATQLLLVGAAAETDRVPTEMPVLALPDLPESGAARGEVFAALLRASPVSTFVAEPGEGVGAIDQFYLSAGLSLSGGADDISISLGSETYPLADFSARLTALVEAFNAQHRRIAFLRISDPEDLFPSAMTDIRAAFDAIGFDMAVMMIDDEAGEADCRGTGTDLTLALLSGVADRTPFGDANEISTAAEVESYLGGALNRLVTRRAECAPGYSLIVKASEEPERPLIAHAGLPALAEIETRLYHETFEAMFLLKSEQQEAVQGFLESCTYCPMETELTARLEGMRSFELSSKLEAEIWERIRNDTATARLEIYLENCVLCAYRDAAETRLSEIDAEAAARKREQDAANAALSTRDISALNAYLAACVACASREAVERAVAEIEADSAYQAERAMLKRAVLSRNVMELQRYLSDCQVCDGEDAARAAMAEAAQLARLSGPCLEAAGVPQLGGPRKLEDISATRAGAICRSVLERFPGDGLLTTTLGRIAQAAGETDDAAAAYQEGMKAGVPSAFGLAAYALYAPQDGGRPDYDAAEELAQRGAELDDWLSKEILTVLYSKDLIEGKSADDAYDIALSMAEEGNPLAQFFVGYFHQTGNGAEPSPDEAKRWLSKAVGQNYLHAYSFLAELYESDSTDATAPERAAGLYWDALKAGDPTARDRLTTQLGNRDAGVIRMIQQRLREEGVYTGGIDGIAGPGTVAAITRFAESTTEPS